MTSRRDVVMTSRLAGMFLYIIFQFCASLKVIWLIHCKIMAICIFADVIWEYIGNVCPLLIPINSDRGVLWTPNLVKTSQRSRKLIFPNAQAFDLRQFFKISIFPLVENRIKNFPHLWHNFSWT